MRRRIVTKEARELREELRETRDVLGDTTVKIEEFIRLIEGMTDVDGS